MDLFFRFESDRRGIQCSWGAAARRIFGKLSCQQGLYAQLQLQPEQRGWVAYHSNWGQNDRGSGCLISNRTEMNEGFRLKARISGFHRVHTKSAWILENSINTLLSDLTIGFEPLISHESGMPWMRENIVSMAFLFCYVLKHISGFGTKMRYFEAVFGASSHESSHGNGSHEPG